MTTEPEISATERLREDLRAVLPSWVVARVLVGLAWLLSLAVSDSIVPGGRTLHQVSGLLGWDGGYYAGIADAGYGPMVREALRFFPLYPLVGRAAGVLVPGPTALVMVVVANLAALGAGILLRRLVLFERGPEATPLAERAVWVLNLSPASFVLVWGYSESLFVLLAIATVLAARRGWFVAAGAAGMAAALTRPVGVLLATAVFIEAVRPWLRRAGAPGPSLPELAARAGAVAAPVLGVGVYLAWVGRAFGDAMLPFSTQGEFREVMDPVRRLGQGLVDLAGVERLGDGLHVPFVLVFLALLVVVARRWPSSYTVYAGLVLLVALSSDNLNSVERYAALNAFPLLIALADVLTTRRRELVALAVCGNGFVALCALAWTAVYVP
jgi:hypothetical protein